MCSKQIWDFTNAEVCVGGGVFWAKSLMVKVCVMDQCVITVSIDLMQESLNQILGRLGRVLHFARC